MHTYTYIQYKQKGINITKNSLGSSVIFDSMKVSLKIKKFENHQFEQELFHDNYPVCIAL